MRSRRLGLLILGVALGIGLLVISCKKSTSPGGGGTPADITIGITGINGSNSYFPNPDTVTVGQTVAWHNADGTTHTATNTGIAVFDTGHLSPGATSRAIQMNTTGSFPYQCSIHGSLMTGTLVVKP